MSTATNLDDVLRQLTKGRAAAPPPVATPTSPPKAPNAPSGENPTTPGIIPRSAPKNVATAVSSGSAADTQLAMPILRDPNKSPATVESTATHAVKPTSELTAGLALAEAMATTVSFIPRAPQELTDAGLNESEVTPLLLKYLLQTGIQTGYQICGQVGLRYAIVEGLLRSLKVDKLVSYKNAMAGGDFSYELTDTGRERARSMYQHCTYYGAAPVPLHQYCASVAAQSLTRFRPTFNDIRRAFLDLSLNDSLVSSVGQAIHSGRGMFLYGPAGNGKTSIAIRISRAFGDSIWIPRAISAGGEIVRLFDPHRHEIIEEANTAEGARNANSGTNATDARWVRIQRPTVVAGGELQMDNLEISNIRGAGIGEAPLQLKSNCGTLLIDDFGRQKMPVDHLLNRWIVPLEMRHDYLHLESGRTIQVPFDQLLVFSTNLEPKDLVDEAFLRRIPYKIEIHNPTEIEFRALFRTVAQSMSIDCPEGMADYLVERHYRAVNRTMRFCHPRDLLRQIENYCTLHEVEFTVTKENLDRAVKNYFSIM